VAKKSEVNTGGGGSVGGEEGGEGGGGVPDTVEEVKEPRKHTRREFKREKKETSASNADNYLGSFKLFFGYELRLSTNILSKGKVILLEMAPLVDECSSLFSFSSGSYIYM
jgi:hypothetical protein